MTRTCALIGCDRACFVDAQTGTHHPYCSRSHAKLFIANKRRRQNDTGDTKARAAEFLDSLAAPFNEGQCCNLPGCEKPRYHDRDAGRHHDYCGRTHAQQHAVLKQAVEPKHSETVADSAGSVTFERELENARLLSLQDQIATGNNCHNTSLPSVYTPTTTTTQFPSHIQNESAQTHAQTSSAVNLPTNDQDHDLDMAIAMSIASAPFEFDIGNGNNHDNGIVSIPTATAMNTGSATIPPSISLPTVPNQLATGSFLPPPPGSSSSNTNNSSSIGGTSASVLGGGGGGGGEEEVHGGSILHFEDGYDEDEAYRVALAMSMEQPTTTQAATAGAKAAIPTGGIRLGTGTATTGQVQQGTMVIAKASTVNPSHGNNGNTSPTNGTTNANSGPVGTIGSTAVAPVLPPDPLDCAVSLSILDQDRINLLEQRYDAAIAHTLLRSENEHREEVLRRWDSYWTCRVCHTDNKTEIKNAPNGNNNNNSSSIGGSGGSGGSSTLELCKQCKEPRPTTWICVACIQENIQTATKCVRCRTAPTGRARGHLPPTTYRAHNAVVAGIKCGLPGCVRLAAESHHGFCGPDHAARARQRQILPPPELGIERVMVGPTGDYTVHLLNRNHPRHESVRHQFLCTWEKAEAGRPRVQRIYRVLVRSEIIQKFDIVAKRVGNVQRRFHGTTQDPQCLFGTKQNYSPCTNWEKCHVCSITSNSFCTDRAKSVNNGVGRRLRQLRYGEGLYFSPVSSKSNDYNEQSERLQDDGRGAKRRWRCMFLCNVAIGRAYVTLEGDLPPQQCPPPGYDSVEGKRGKDLNYDEVVVYSSEMALPSYLIVYSLDP